MELEEEAELLEPVEFDVEMDAPPPRGGRPGPRPRPRPAPRPRPGPRGE